MNKKLEAEIVKNALRELVKKDLTILQLQKDLLSSLAERLGVARSTLSVWSCPSSRTHLSTEGLRLIAQHLQVVGADDCARDFIAKIVLNPLGMRLDSGRQGRMFG